MFGFRMLGSGVQWPSPRRYLTSILTLINGDNLLFDVPENTQVQLRIHGNTLSLDRILLTAIESDTVLGLSGLLSTLNSQRDENISPQDIMIYVPDFSGAKDLIEKALYFSSANPQVKYVSAGETIVSNNTYNIKTFQTKRKGRGQSLGYRVEEPEKRGRFNREKAEELGVPVGPKFKRLHSGESVELDDGRVIEPSQVVGPSRPGRSLVYTGSTEYLKDIPKSAQDADVFICDGGMTSEYSKEKACGHMTAYQAGTFAGAANASLIIPTHIRNQYPAGGGPLVDEVTDAFDGPYLIGTDGLRAVLRTQEANTEATRIRDTLGELKGHPSVGNFNA